MRITIVTGPWLPVPPLRGGAMQKSWLLIARELARGGDEVTLVARSFPDHPPEERHEGVRILRPRGFAQTGRLALDLAKDLLYAANAMPRLPRADLLVTNDFWLPALAPRLRGAAGRVVVSAARFPKGQYRLYGGVARVVAISSAVREAIVAEQPMFAGRTAVVPLPVELERFRGAERRRGASVSTLLYCGRVHSEKGIGMLLEAFAGIAPRHPAWRLAIVGPTREAEGGGGEPFARSLRALAAGLPVEWHEPVWEADALARVYAAADLFVYPSLAERGEAFGVAALEAMAAGVPPVVSDLACFRDFVRAGENGWVFDHRGDEGGKRLATTLSGAMDDATERARRGAAARRTAEEFGVLEIARRLRRELEAAMAAAPAR